MIKRLGSPDGGAKGVVISAQISKFLLTGGAGTSVHYLVLIVLVNVTGMLPGGAAFAGAAIGACVVYWLNRSFTFATQRSHAETLPRFAAMAIAGAIMNGALVGMLNAAGLHYLIAQASATVAVLIFNFIVSKLWIFR